LGFYKSQNIDEKGLMTKSLSTVIDYSFNTLELDKIYSEVFEGNSKSLAMHKRLL
jgi:RimJ/RimL family protein N-acetyltransferase